MGMVGLAPKARRSIIVRHRTDSPWRTWGNPKAFGAEQRDSIGADPTDVPEVNRAFSANVCFDFHNPGALPQALM